jgi:two-component system, sensor histidine kinase and response regulator
MSMEEIRGIAFELNQSVNNTLDLTNNLLTWARLQMESMEYNPKNIDISQVIAEQIALFSLAAQAKGNQLVSNVTENTKVFADGNHLDFILRNLLANAIKFTQQGKIMILARTQEEMIEIAVADSGVGMSVGFAKNIFDVGQKSSTQGTAGEKGTGLGLPLCKEFVEKNGGKIWVETIENKGSIFFFTLRSQN